MAPEALGNSPWRAGKESTRLDVRRRAGLPTFEFLSARDVHIELTLRGSRGAVLREYMGYIEQLDPEHAGRLTAEESESTATVRRRLGAAAQLLGKSLEVAGDGRVVYFREGEDDRQHRRGGPRRSEGSG